MSLMDSAEIENIEKWLEPTEFQGNNDDSPKKPRFENEKRIDEHELNFSLIKALKETGLELTLKPRDATALQDSFFAIQQLISPTYRRNSQPGFERTSTDQVEERHITMQLSKLVEALGYTRDAKNKTSARDDESNIHAEVDRILKDLELSLEKVDAASSDAEGEEGDDRILANLLEDDVFREDRKLNSPQPNMERRNDQDPIRIENNMPQTNLEIPVKIAVERASPDDKTAGNIMIIEQKPEASPEKPREQITEITLPEKVVKKAIKLQKKKKNCAIF